MRPSLPLAAATASLLVLGAGAAVARGGHDTAARSGQATAAATTFRVVEHADTDATTDTGAQGDSAVTC